MRMTLPMDTLRASMEGLDRKKAAKAALWAAAPLALIILVYFLYGLYADTRRLASIKSEEAARFSVLKDEYLGKKAAVDSLSSRAAGRGESVMKVIEDIARAVGAKERVTSIKPLDERQTLNYIERDAEAKFERIELNRLVNLLYMMEHGENYLLVVKEFSMKERFDSPNLLDVRMRLTYVSRP